MRSAVGNALLLSLVVSIVSVVMLLFISTLSYVKAYRVKNRIIEIIEKYGSYEKDGVKDEIATYLQQVGYQLGKCDLDDQPRDADHPDGMGWNFSAQDTRGYKYCVAGVYEDQGNPDEGYRYYIVTTYVEFRFPLIDKLLSIPVRGETKVLNVDYGSMDE